LGGAWYRTQAVLCVTVSLGMNDLILPDSRLSFGKLYETRLELGTNMALVWLDLWIHFRWSIKSKSASHCQIKCETTSGVISRNRNLSRSVTDHGF